MSEYVIVTNKGSCYSYICKNSAKRKVALCCDAGTYVDGASPENGKKYKKICENEHPASPGRIVVTIEDEDTGQRYVIGDGGITHYATTMPAYSDIYWNDDEDQYIATKKQSIIKNEENPTVMDEKIKVGDLVIVKKPGDGHDGELMKITHLKAYNYDYVVCYPHQNVAQYGYNKGQVVKYVPEPELPEDQKPAFSRSELIEILEQNKPAEEILLDIRDHITN